MNRARTLLTTCLLWLAWGVLLTAACLNATKVITLSPTASLRYPGGVDQATAENARRFAAETEEWALWPTYWRETAGKLQSELNEAYTTLLAYDGDPTLLWQGTLLEGRWPGQAEAEVVTLSSALAWQLFGGTGVVGRTVKLEGTPYTVAGVFEDDRALALISMHTAPLGGWQGVELAGDMKASAADTAESFATASGLGQPAVVLTAALPVFLANAFAWLPTALLALYALYRLWRWLRLPPAARWGIAFLAGLIFALALPTLLALVPASLLPTRWSDLAHWSGWLSGIRSTANGWLALTPSLRDIGLKWALIRAAALLGGMLLLFAPLARRCGSPRGASPEQAAPKQPHTIYLPGPHLEASPPNASGLE